MNWYRDPATKIRLQYGDTTYKMVNYIVGILVNSLLSKSESKLYL